jgi:CBS domain-containing protein
MKVLELMRVHVNTIGPDATLPDAIDIMDLYQVVTVPVVDADGAPLGVVTESDVEDALLIPFEAAASALPSATREADISHLVERARTTRIADVMSAPAVCVDEETDVIEAASLILSHGFKRLPVTSGGRVIGTIGRIDICQGVMDGAR